MSIAFGLDVKRKRENIIRQIDMNENNTLHCGIWCGRCEKLETHKYTNSIYFNLFASANISS